MKKKVARLSLTPGWAEYLRTSDEDAQAPERSQGYQHRCIENMLIAPSGLPLIDTYADTMSGKITGRADYQRLLADARLGKFSHMGVYHVDRFGRKDVELLTAVSEILDIGITIRFAFSPSLHPETPEGRMMLTMLMGYAHHESSRTSERTTNGMKEKLHVGDWAWLAPDGYKNEATKKRELDAIERRKHAKEKHWVAVNPERFKIWREAWDLLLTDQYTLAAICEILHSRGYTRQQGEPFVEVTPDGKRKPGAKFLSYAFHNWFYAGWLVVDNDWETVPPKTRRGNWQPLVTTEEFERGLSILAKRNRNRQHKARNFYLLQQLLFVAGMDGTPEKLTCSTSNTRRKSGGTAYYRMKSLEKDIPCAMIDDQIHRWMQNIHVADDYLSAIRDAYRADVTALLHTPKEFEKARLEAILKKNKDEEMTLMRFSQADLLSEENLMQRFAELRDQRLSVQAQLQLLTCESEAQIASLDDALTFIAKAGILYTGLTPAGQQDLLRLMVEQIMVSPEGQITHVKLHAPFGYLARLIADKTDGTTSTETQSPSRKGKNTTGKGLSACSSLLKACVPAGNRTQINGFGGHCTIRYATETLFAIYAPGSVSLRASIIKISINQ